MPLGLLMLSRGFVNEAQVQAALLTQREEQCDKIGQWLQRLGFATERQVVTALGLQYATPVLAFPAEIVPQRILPIELLKSLRIMPVRLSTSQHLLYIAFCSPVDYTLLQSIEKMTDYRTSACLISDACMGKLLARAEEREISGSQYFARMSDPDEVARITLSYASRVGATEIRFVKCNSLVWVRLHRHGKNSDLIFEVADFHRQYHDGSFDTSNVSSHAIRRSR
jgi:hypothetical protein